MLRYHVSCEICLDFNVQEICYSHIRQLFFQSDVKKPRCTKYTHRVQLQENGATYQRTVELTLKQSAVGIGTPVSPSLSNRSVSIIDSELYDTTWTCKYASASKME